MPRVHITSFDRTMEAEPGSCLLDVLRKTGIGIETPCGGQGTCGRCRVRVVSGSVSFEERGVLDRAAVAAGWVLACRARLTGEDIDLEFPHSDESTLDTGIEIPPDERVTPHLLDPADTPSPVVASADATVPLPAAGDGFSDTDRFRNVLRPLVGEDDFTIALGALRSLPASIRCESGRVNVSWTDMFRPPRILTVTPGKKRRPRIGAAVDIGTTTVSVQLVDLRSAAILGSASGGNGQITCGADVIGRINYARRPGGLDELRRLVVETVNRLMDAAAHAASIDPGVISAASVAGNTTMMHLLLGVDPEHLRLEPYVPAFRDITPFDAGDVGFCIDPDAPVIFAPAVASYVGGDIISGLTCSDFHEKEDMIGMFLDVGTNGELVLGNRDFLMCCACSAGPAFEGGGIGCGTRAVPGAVSRVTIEPASGKPRVGTIGGIPPIGICGTGVISLIATLFETGWIDRRGRFDRSRESAHIEITGRRASFILVPAEESGTGGDLRITETDIESVLRAKAAIYSASAFLLEQVGLSIDDIGAFHLAGGFGRVLDIEQAITIGLLPDLPRDRFRYLGNTSLEGAALALVSRPHRDMAGELAARITSIDINTAPDYMTQYTGAMFLPHTDPGLFPSVAGRIPSP